MLSALVLLVPAAATAHEQRLPWRFMDPVAAAAFDGLRQSDDPFAETLTMNLDADDRQGREQEDGRSLNFDPASNLFFAVRDLDDDGRPEVFLLPLGPGSSGSSARASGVVMVEDGSGRWRIACGIVELLRQRDGGGLGVFVGSAGGRDRWRGFRTLEGPYGWRRMRDGSGRMECLPVAGRIAGPVARRGERLLRWRSIDQAAASALDDFRRSTHPIADAMAINHEGTRIGVNRAPGRPRNFDPAFDLLYAVREMGGGRGPLVFLLFDWPMLRRDGEPLPGVVMVENRPTTEPRRRWRIACTISDDGDRASAGGVTLLGTRSEGLPNFRTSAGTHAWRPAPDTPGLPECHRIAP